MGDETWASIQLVKNKREIFREKLKRRKAERDTILSVAGGSSNHSKSNSGNSSFPIGMYLLSIKFYKLVSYLSLLLRHSCDKEL